jgi:hypothetical protein
MIALRTLLQPNLLHPGCAQRSWSACTVAVDVMACLPRCSGCDGVLAQLGLPTNLKTTGKQ